MRYKDYLKNKIHDENRLLNGEKTVIVIKHRKEKSHNYYRVDCNCGCVFAFDEVEFRNYKTLGVAPDINCPECGTNYVNGSDNIKLISKEEYQKYIEEVQK